MSKWYSRRVYNQGSEGRPFLPILVPKFVNETVTFVKMTTHFLHSELVTVALAHRTEYIPYWLC